MTSCSNDSKILLMVNILFNKIQKVLTTEIIVRKGGKYINI